MPEVQGSGAVHERDPDSAGPDHLAVQGVPGPDATTDTGHPPAEQQDAQARAVAARHLAHEQASEASCWRDGQDLFHNHIVQPTGNGRVYRFRDGPRSNLKTTTVIASYPINGTAIWHYAKCSCAAGEKWGDPCAHKVAAFWLARIRGHLPRLFPDF